MINLSVKQRILQFTSPEHLSFLFVEGEDIYMYFKRLNVNYNLLLPCLSELMTDKEMETQTDFSFLSDLHKAK